MTGVDDDDAQAETDIRAVFEAGYRESVADLARQMREAGHGEYVVECATTAFAKMLADRLEREVPMILRDMKITAGEARMQ